LPELGYNLLRRVRLLPRYLATSSAAAELHYRRTASTEAGQQQRGDLRPDRNADQNPILIHPVHRSAGTELNHSRAATGI
jgi:hypothetical protein